MKVLPAFVGFVTVVFFCTFGALEAFAQETITVDLKSCPPQSGSSDPTIVTEKEVTTDQDCRAPAFTSSVKVVDHRYGIEFSLQGPFGVTEPPKVIEPMPEDLPATHDRCTIAYPTRGVIAEWVVLKGEVCKERGQTFRLLKPGDELCLMPRSKCIKIAHLTPRAQERAQKLKKELERVPASARIANRR